jgi:hypothetical protein
MFSSSRSHCLIRPTYFRTQHTVPDMTPTMSSFAHVVAVYLGVKFHLGPKTRQLRVCSCGAPSLTRGRVCGLQLKLTLASVVILGSEPPGSHDYIQLSQVRDSLNLEGRVPIFMSPRNRVNQLYSPRHWIPFSSPPRTHSRGIPTSFHTGLNPYSRNRLHTDS